MSKQKLLESSEIVDEYLNLATITFYVGTPKTIYEFNDSLIEDRETICLIASMIQKENHRNV